MNAINNQSLILDMCKNVLKVLISTHYILKNEFKLTGNIVDNSSKMIDNVREVVNHKNTSYIDQVKNIDKNIKNIQQQVKDTPHTSNKTDDIIIIDKGVTIRFPNFNYPVEIRTYYPFQNK